MDRIEKSLSGLISRIVDMRYVSKVAMLSLWLAYLTSVSLAQTVPQRMSMSEQAPFVRNTEMNAQFHRAEAAWKSGASMLEAKARIDRVLRELPDDVEALKLRSKILIALERPEEAIDDARHALEFLPDDVDTYLILCEAARLSGNTLLAGEALLAAEKRMPQRPDMLLRMAFQAGLIGFLDQAETFARTAMAAAPRDPSAYYQLASVLVLREQMDAAADLLLQGLRDAVVDADRLRKDSLLSRALLHPRLSSYR